MSDPNFKPCKICEKDDYCDLQWHRKEISSLQSKLQEAEVKILELEKLPKMVSDPGSRIKELEKIIDCLPHPADWDAAQFEINSLTQEKAALQKSLADAVEINRKAQSKIFQLIIPYREFINVRSDTLKDIAADMILFFDGNAGKETK